MLFRDHPLMTFKGARSWPPVWIWTGGAKNKRPRGEVGILQAVLPSNIEPADRCFLYIEYDGSTYIGSLLMEDHAFCRQVMRLLRRHCDCPIAEIGSLDLTYTF
jgi:hypothetical protein